MKSKRGDAKKKASQVSGEIQLQFSLVDPANPNISPADILTKFRAITGGSPSEEKDEDLRNVPLHFKAHTIKGRNIFCERAKCMLIVMKDESCSRK